MPDIDLTTRTILETDLWRVTTIPEVDEYADSDCFPQFETDEERKDFQNRLHDGDFVYVTLDVRVYLNGQEVALATLGGTEYGQVMEDVFADVWEWVPSRKEGQALIGGSKLYELTQQAIGETQVWLQGFMTPEMAGIALAPLCIAFVNKEK